MFDLIKPTEALDEPYRAKNYELSVLEILRESSEQITRCTLFLVQSAIESEKIATLFNWIAMCCYVPETTFHH